MKTIVLLTAAAAALAVGCNPPHYSVSVAHGPTHVTYAQRHHNGAENDYLVDCQVDPQGTPTNCQIIELVAYGE